MNSITEFIVRRFQIEGFPSSFQNEDLPSSFSFHKPMSHEGLMTIIQHFCAGSSPFSSPKRHHSDKEHPLNIWCQPRGCSNTCATDKVGISVHHGSPPVSLDCSGPCLPCSPALFRWLFNQGLKPVRGSCQLVSLSESETSPLRLLPNKLPCFPLHSNPRSDLWSNS